MANRNLQAAKTAKKDEFFTQLTDIEKELMHYKEHFRGKTVICNCDDPRVSNFFVYFKLNFKHLGLKRLICTCYKSQNVDLFGDHSSEKAVYIDYYGEEENILPLKGDGDFRSEECIELLKQADIVVTNPPFSLFREYVAQLMKYEKKFLIIGNVNAITLKEFFPFMKDNRIWLGQSIHSGDREFSVPEDYPLNAAGCRIDEDGHKYIRVKGVRWFTNLDYSERHEELVLYKKYNSEDYPSYINFDSIEVNKTSDIPCDYNNIMAVPVTFMDKYCPEQFDIIGLLGNFNPLDCSVKSGFYCGTNVRHLNMPGISTGPLLKTETGYKAVYKRILIRRKQKD